MRILHTGDWHLGKHLEGFSRLEEQRIFIEELIQACDEKQIDVIVIAGDIYDTSNPPAQAEKLYYDALKKLSKGGKRPIFAIAGNHDNPDRIQAAWPLASEQAIFLAGHPTLTEYSGKFGQHEIQSLGEGVLSIKIGQEKLNIGLLPYPSEKRLNEVLGTFDDDTIKQSTYSKRVGKLFKAMDTQFRADAFNLVVSHLFVMGGETTESERPIQIGGTLVVDQQDLPDKADYIALGHLHRPQPVRRTKKKAYYAGAPLQYSRSERGYAKVAYIVDSQKVKSEQDTWSPESLHIALHKPIEVWRCSHLDDAYKVCEANGDRAVWAYLEIETDQVLSQSEIKKLKELKPDLLSIMPILKMQESEDTFEKPEERGFENLFEDFYIHEKGVQPKDELKHLLGSILNNEVNHATDQIDDQWVEQLYRQTDD